MKKRTSKLLSISLSALLILHMIVMGGFTPHVSASTTPSLEVTMKYNNDQDYDGSFMTVHPVTITASSTNNKDIEYSKNYGVVWEPYPGAITVSDVGVHHYLFREVGEIPMETANVHIMPSIENQKVTPTVNTIYVKANSSGNGTSWDTAFPDLQSALDVAATKASSGDSVQIFVAEGTYYPTKEIGGSGDRYKTFQLQNNVAIYGGFDATTGKRDIKGNETILSGNIGDTSTETDNAYHVFYHPTETNLNATAVLDGVTITGGHANGSGADSEGGGMYNEGSSPTLTNVTFSGNTASSGGGMNNNGSSPTLENVTFSGNTASSSFSTSFGGGMYNWNSSPTLKNVTFSGNTASISSSPSITTSSGGGMFNYYSSPTLKNVTFSGNTAYRSGGGMYNWNSSSLTLKNVTISENTASSSGGGMFNYYSSPTLTNVTMSGNTASYGGGMYNNSSGSSSNPILTNVTMSGNTASRDGGGMYNNSSGSSSNPILTNVTMSGNTASSSGGGMYNNSSSSSSSNPILTNVTMSGNRASSGGGMSNTGSSSPTLTNVTMSGNTAISNGGGMYNEYYSGPTLTNVTMSGNKSNGTAGTIYGGTPTIQNSIIIGNHSEPALAIGTTSTIANSLLDVDEEDGTTVGRLHTTDKIVSNETYQPAAIFIDPSKQDYRLRANSIAINAGDSSINSTETDLAGNKRTQGIIDLGAYEAFPYTVTYDANGATGNVPVDPFTYASGDTVTVKAIDRSLEKYGYTFGGWNTQADGNGTTYAAGSTYTMGTTDVTFYAQWAPNTYTVTFSSDGTTFDTASVRFNEQAIAPTDPSKTGHTFAGWYKDTVFTTEWKFATDVVTADTTLYANWALNRYTVSFDVQGGAAVASQTVQHNEKATDPSTPTKAGYTFTGWYHNGIVWDFDTPVVSDMTLTAGWQAIPSSGGGGGGYVPTPVQPPSNTEIIEVDIVDPNDPTKVYVKTKVVRKTENGRVTDTIEFKNEHAAELVKQLAGQQGTAMIVLPPQPHTDETFIQLSQEAVSILAENGVQVMVSMGAVQLQLPVASLAQMTDDVTFKVTPLKEGSNDFVEDAQKASAFANAMTVTILGQPVRIETNMQGVPVVLTLPVDGDFVEEDLYAYIAHSDGSTEVKQGKLVEFSPGVKGFQFEVDHFSVFGVVHAP